MSEKLGCDGCKWWSERIAESIGCEPIRAYCFNEQSDRYKKMVNRGCEHHEPGRAIDDPSPRYRSVP